MDFSEHRIRLQLNTDWGVNKSTNVLHVHINENYPTFQLSSKHLGKSKRNKDIFINCVFKIKSN